MIEQILEHANRLQKMKMLILLTMIFFHIVDDYYLQGWLASGKQRSWWKKNAPDKIYQYDYLMALFMHSFSWAFMVMLPAIVYVIANSRDLKVWYLLVFISNLTIHFVTDNAKANLKLINLIQDQSIHLGQIVITWILIVSEL